jgi:hypothetical protein
VILLLPPYQKKKKKTVSTELNVVLLSLLARVGGGQEVLTVENPRTLLRSTDTTSKCLLWARLFLGRNMARQGKSKRTPPHTPWRRLVKGSEFSFCLFLRNSILGNILQSVAFQSKLP